MSDSITALIAGVREAEGQDGGCDPLLIKLAGALESVVAERDERELALSTVPGYTRPEFFKQEFRRVLSDLVSAEAERDRYRAEAESARKTGERILADALRYRAAIQTARDVEESSYLLATGRWPDEHNSTSTLRILTRALTEGAADD